MTDIMPTPAATIDVREIDRSLVSGVAWTAALKLIAQAVAWCATLFVARPDTPTIPIAISRFLARPGALNVGQAMAMSTVLMFVTGFVVFAIEHVHVRQLGEF